jgi:hypothetical protein
VMLGNPLSMNAHVNERPATVRGKLVWPREDMAKQIASLR